MLPIQGLYEVALRVKNLPQAEAFYCDILGLEVGLRDEPRKWLFLRAGGQAGMIVLQEDPAHWSQQHLASPFKKPILTGLWLHSGSKALASKAP